MTLPSRFTRKILATSLAAAATAIAFAPARAQQDSVQLLTVQGRVHMLVGAGARGATDEILRARAVGELATRLGWKFDSVEQGTDPPGATADADGLDRLL